ncbi:putative reverse transcriptase domain-containing protein [Tanacetum coccineum]
MSMTIQSDVKDKIVATKSETSKVENAPAEMLHDLDQQMEKRVDDGCTLWIKLYSKYEYEIRYHPDRANVVIDALRKKERVKPRRVRAMAMTIQYRVRGMILAAQSEAFKQENILTERLHGVGKGKPKAAGDRQKSYADNRRKPLEFEVGDRVMLKVSPWKGDIHFGKKGKLAPRFLMSFLDDGRGSDSWMFLFVWSGYAAMRTLLWAGKVVSSWVGAEGEEVKGGDVVLEVTKREKWWNGGELDGGLMRQHARTLIRAVRFRVLFSFLSLDDFSMVMIKELLEFGNEDAFEEMDIYRWTYAPGCEATTHEGAHTASTFAIDIVSGMVGVGRRLKGCSSGSKNSISSNYNRTRRQKRQKLTPTSRTMDRGDRYRDDPIRKTRLKIKIPEFTCKVHSDDFIDWLSTVEWVFDVRDIPDKLKEKMKKLMKAKYLPENHRQEAFLDYHNMSQRNMTMEEVINEFDKLRMRCDVVEEEEEQVLTRFVGVLKPEIADIVSLQPYWTYTDVCILALKVEKQIKTKSKGSTSRVTPPTRTASPIGPKIAPKATTPTMPLVVTNPTYDTDTEPEVDKPCDELVYPDRGEALVIYRVLNEAVSKSVNDNPCENVISTYMVEKLGMKTEDHPEPYELTWLKKGNIVKVSKRFLVQFYIGKIYKDEVWCEVIPMDAAHILLGRPWQFDKKTKHDGFQNTYSFKKDGVNITLVPFDSRQTQAGGSNLFIKKTNFEGLAKTSPYVFTLVVVEENEIISEAPLQVQPLLKELADVILDDIPHGLPAMRDIQHCIDFIPGSAILNRPAYRMNPKEFAKLQR